MRQADMRITPEAQLRTASLTVTFTNNVQASSCTSARKRGASRPSAAASVIRPQQVRPERNVSRCRPNSVDPVSVGAAAICLSTPCCLRTATGGAHRRATLCTCGSPRHAEDLPSPRRRFIRAWRLALSVRLGSPTRLQSKGSGVGRQRRITVLWLTPHSGLGGSRKSAEYRDPSETLEPRCTGIRASAVHSQRRRRARVPKLQNGHYRTTKAGGGLDSALSTLRTRRFARIWLPYRKSSGTPKPRCPGAYNAE
jgi:hypothetical protein